MNKKLNELKTKANNLPLLPGVYLMLDSKNEVIYVGKAKKLKNRVTSYFHGDHLPKVSAMVEKIADFNVIIANSEFEALILENSLIKQHKPHYNILLKHQTFRGLFTQIFFSVIFSPFFMGIIETIVA